MYMEKIIWKAVNTNFLLNNNLSWAVAYRLSFVYNKPGKVASICEEYQVFSAFK